ncbi:MAG TPA: hypothetical protein PKM97_05570 [Bacteroidia bacterium]|nr:hypothetical protein [Bacteroidia bacterium]
MSKKDFRIFPEPDPKPEGEGINSSDIKDVFIVVYHVDGTEMMSFRKSYMDIKNVNIDEMISLHPANNFVPVEEVNKKDLKKKYFD